MFFNKAMKGMKFNFQKNADVFEDFNNLKDSLFNVIKDLTNGTEVPIEWISDGQAEDSKLGEKASTAVSVQRIAGVPLEEVEDEHFLKLDDSDKDIPPILISNMVDNIPEEFNEVGIGEGCITEKEEESRLLETIKNKISSSNLSASSKHHLSTLLIENKGALGLKQSNAQMSLMTPISVTLKAGSRALRSDGYHLAPEQEDFLELKFRALRDAGIVEPAKNPIWGHPVFVVPKKMAKPDAWNSYTNEEKEKWKADNILNRFRMVSNMVRLNKITVPTSLNLPNLERQLFSIKGSRVYATLDILSGFDFLETEEKSKDIFTLVTRRSAWRLRGAPMGWMNTPALFCERVVNEVVDGIEKLFGRATNGVICWLDDLLVYAESEDHLLRMLKLLLLRAAEMKVRFNLRKCDFAAATTLWCAQIVYLANWLSPNIPKLAELRKPFSKYANLEGKKLIDIERKKERIQWNDELDRSYEELKRAIVEASKRFLSTYDKTSPLLLFTDSSYDVWSMAIFQDVHANVTNDIRTLAPKPLMFISGSFSTSEVRWHIASKELYPIIYAFERVGFLLRTHPGGLYVYTDHRALLSILKTKEDEKRIYWDRLYRWAIRLQSVDLTVFHIPSRDNFVSDLLTRWAVESKPLLARLSHPLVSNMTFREKEVEEIRMYADDVYLEDATEDEDGALVAQLTEASSSGEDFYDEIDFTNIDDSIRYARTVGRLFYVRDDEGSVYCAHVHSSGTDSAATPNNGGAGDNEGETRRWVKSVEESVDSDMRSVVEELFEEHISYLSPFYYGKNKGLNDRVIARYQKQLPDDFKARCEDKENLLYFKGKLVVPKPICTRFIVMNHTLKAHPSRTAELLSLKDIYFHNIPMKDFKLLLKSFRRRCLHCQREPALIRRPYKLTPLARRTREIIRADYLYINDGGYVLVLLDSCSRKVMLHYADQPTASFMVEGLMRWRADLGFADQFGIITDNGSHFSNQLMKKLAKAIGFEQTFTVAYSPLSNGSVETVNSQIFLNLKLKTPLLRKSRRYFALRIQDDLQAPADVSQLISTVDQLREEMDRRMEVVYNTALLQRQAELERINRSRGLIVQFAPGDYVMVSEQGTQEALSKLKLTWLGPYQVTQVLSESVYEVESIMGKRKVVHGTRMWFYGSRPPTMNPKLKSLFIHNISELEVDNIHRIRLTTGQEAKYEALVSWRGFERSRDTWQDLTLLYEDLSQMVRGYVEANLLSSSMKNNILTELDILDAKRLEKIKSNKTQKRTKKGGKNKVAALIQHNFHKVWNTADNKESKTLGWYDQEKDVLKALILKFGCGNYEAYSKSPFLPNRSKQQISSQIQRLLGLQAIGLFHGKHFEVEAARKFLEDNFGIKGFHKNLPGKLNLFQEKEEVLRQFNLEVAATDEEVTACKIPYFRRLDDPEHVKLLIQEFNTEECKQFLGNTKFETKKDLQLILDKYKNEEVAALKQSEKLIEECYKLMLLNKEIWNDLSERYSYISNTDNDFTGLKKDASPSTYKTEEHSLSLRYKDDEIELSFLDFSDANIVPFRFYYTGGNLFTMPDHKATFYLEPPDSTLYFGNVFDLTFDHPNAKKNIYSLIIMDPPWTVGSGNPTRGVTLPYPTISNSSFKKLKMPLNHFPFGSILCVWVTNQSYATVLDWAFQEHFYLIEDLAWLKKNPTGKLHKSIGYFLQHSQETCLIFERKANENVKYNNTFEEDNVKLFSRYFYSRPLAPSVKPEIFYKMLRDTFPTRRAIEYFGRWNNIRMDWTTCGLDLIPPAHLAFYQHSRTGSS
eukprot:augustus_masked-scaffold_99-processed-gene-0.2-mRNA-1 protein AED:1.00 eAED:1.00 QI:0/0/0/0/1/1/3/0/1782